MTSEPIASVPTETRFLFDGRLLSMRMAATDQVARLGLEREVVSRPSLLRLAIIFRLLAINLICQSSQFPGSKTGAKPRVRFLFCYTAGPDTVSLLRRLIRANHSAQASGRFLDETSHRILTVCLQTRTRDKNSDFLTLLGSTSFQRSIVKFYGT